MRQYLPALIQIAAGLSVAIGMIVFSLLVGKRAHTSVDKDKAYECGKNPVVGPTPRFSVKFYIVAMIFVLFDIEVIFMYPWAIAFSQAQSLTHTFQDALASGLPLIVTMLVFVLVVEVGHIYAFKRGVFDWNKRG